MVDNGLVQITVTEMRKAATARVIGSAVQRTKPNV